MNRRICVITALIYLSAALGVCSDAQAHVGDRVVQIYEVPSSDIPDIDDLSIFEWENIVPEPSLDSRDFSSLQLGSPSSHDLAVRIHLAWNMGTQRLYMAMQRTDDIYINQYAGGDPPNFFGADHLEFYVDGDHSGGQYACGPPDGTEAQVRHYVGAQAQRGCKRCVQPKPAIRVVGAVDAHGGKEQRNGRGRQRVGRAQACRYRHHGGIARPAGQRGGRRLQEDRRPARGQDLDSRNVELAVAEHHPGAAASPVAIQIDHHRGCAPTGVVCMLQLAPESHQFDILAEVR